MVHWCGTCQDHFINFLSLLNPGDFKARKEVGRVRGRCKARFERQLLSAGEDLLRARLLGLAAVSLSLMTTIILVQVCAI
jgi:hypothetical protein